MSATIKELRTDLKLSQAAFAKSIGISTLIGMASTIMITYTLQPLFFRWIMKWPFMQRRVQKM